MKPTMFLVYFSLISLIKIVNGQHIGFYNENCETNSPEQQPVLNYAFAKSIRDLLSQNENIPTLLNNNQNQILTQINTPPSSPDTQQLQLPPDIQQQPLQVQQYLQLQKPLQLQPSTLLSQTKQTSQKIVSPLTQLEYPLELQLDAQSFIPLQSQDIPQLQQPIQRQPQLVLDQPLQPFQTLMLKQNLPTLDSSQPLQAKQLQQSVGFQQYSPQNVVDIPVKQKENSVQPNPQIQTKWQVSNPIGATKVENSCNHNLNIQPLQTTVNSPVEIITIQQKNNEKPQEIQVLRYVLSQPPSATVSGVSVPVVSKSIATKEVHNIKPMEETYVPIKLPYNYVIPILSNQNTNTQLNHYEEARDLKQNPFINHNSGIHYPEQSQRPVIIQNQPTALFQGQSSIPSPILQTPSISSQYAVSSSYPVSTIVAPAYTRHNSVSSGLKSLMPLIFQLLKEKITTIACNDDCPCECKNNRNDDEIEVTNEYRKKIEYCPFDTDTLPVLDTISEEEQGPGCLREPKNCEEFENSSVESDEMLEEQDSDEEEVEDDEES